VETVISPKFISLLVVMVVGCTILAPTWEVPVALCWAFAPATEANINIIVSNPLFIQQQIIANLAFFTALLSFSAPLTAV
jgi:hypothetical protein